MPNALIVEDEPEANKLLSILVQLRGYRTDSAFTGGEALAMVDRRPPDIVFLDLMLPDINGYEVCKALKGRKDTALIPVVMVTARVAVENRIQSYCIGADHYVPKPYTPDQIYQAMDDADDWRRRLESNGSAGEIPYNSRDEGETLRRLAQLRSELLACTPLDTETVCRVNESLRNLWTLADAWGQKHGVSAVASLAYRVEPGEAVLTLRDLSGWFRDDPRSAAERWPDEVAHGGYDAVEADRPAGTVCFVVRFPDAKAANPGGNE